MPDNTTTTAATAIDLTLQHLQGQHHDPRLTVLNTNIPNVRAALAVTDTAGLEVEILDDRELLDEPPIRPKGTRVVSETLGFLDELARYPLTPGISTLWGDYTKGRIHAVYNDHATAGAGHRDNILALHLVADEYWTAWHTLSGKYLPQEEFGDAVEQLLHTVIDPSQADLMEIIDSVRASSSGEFESRIERSHGAQKISFTQDVTTRAGRTGQLEVPQTITLRLRPWEGQIETYEVPAWFRLRVTSGQLLLCIQLKPTNEILRQSWADTVRKIVDTVGIPVVATRNP